MACAACCRLQEHYDWLQEQLAQAPHLHPPHQRPFWQSLALVMEQWQGMQEGYAARLQEVGPHHGIQDIPFIEWLTLNTMGELFVPRKDGWMDWLGGASSAPAEWECYAGRC